MINELQYTKAKKEHLDFSARNNAPHKFLRLMVVKKLESIFSQKINKISGINVYTTIDSQLQSYFKTRSKKIDIDGDQFLSFISMKPNGEIVAYGGQSKDSNFDIIQGGFRSIGAHTNSFFYGSAIKRGYHLSTDIYSPSKQLDLEINDGKSIYEAYEQGLSYENLRLAYKIGMKNVEADLEAMGFTIDQQKDLFKIGIKSSAYNLISSYNIFNNTGNFAKPFVIKYILNSNGEKIYSSKPRQKRVLTNSEAILLSL